MIGKRQHRPRPAERYASEIAALNATAQRASGLQIAFLTFASALFILVSGTDHEALLRETPLELPFFQVGVPLTSFYVVAPILFVLMHLNMLNKLAQLRMQIADLPEIARPTLKTAIWQFDYALLFGGFVERFWEKAVLWIIVVTTLVIMPPLLLIYVQYQFLAYHSDIITWIHKGLVTADVAALAALFVAFVPRRARSDAKPVAKPLWPRLKTGVTGWRRWSGIATFAFFAALCLLVSVWFLTPRDRLQWMASEWRDEVWGDREFLGSIEPILGLQRNLLLPNRTFWAEDPPPENVAAYQTEHGFSAETFLAARRLYGKPLNLGGRDLRYAALSGSSLIDANLNTSKLQGALLDDANLQGAYLAKAQLQGADLFSARLQGADLTRAQLQGANLLGAQLQSADLEHAQLQGADLSSAQLQGADLEHARLQGANLLRARLQGANLTSASLQGADLRFTELQGTNFQGVNITATPDWDEIASLAETLPHGEIRERFIERIAKAKTRTLATNWRDADDPDQVPLGALPGPAPFDWETPDTSVRNQALFKIACENPYAAFGVARNFVAEFVVDQTDLDLWVREALNALSAVAAPTCPDSDKSLAASIPDEICARHKLQGCGSQAPMPPVPTAANETAPQE